MTGRNETDNECFHREPTAFTVRSQDQVNVMTSLCAHPDWQSGSRTAHASTTTTLQWPCLKLSFGSWNHELWTLLLTLRPASASSAANRRSWNHCRSEWCWGWVNCDWTSGPAWWSSQAGPWTQGVAEAAKLRYLHSDRAAPELRRFENG